MVLRQPVLYDRAPIKDSNKKHHGEHQGALGLSNFLRLPNESNGALLLAGTVLRGSTSASHTAVSVLEWALTVRPILSWAISAVSDTNGVWP